jgi:hypothetical protein
MSSTSEELAAQSELLQEAVAFFKVQSFRDRHRGRNSGHSPTNNRIQFEEKLQNPPTPNTPTAPAPKQTGKKGVDIRLDESSEDFESDDEGFEEYR